MSAPADNGAELRPFPGSARGQPAAAIIAALFCGYLAVGLPLPVIPLFIHDRLGFSNFVVGFVIGIQFLATVLTRGYAGRLTDRHGGRRTALQGAAVCAVAGGLYLIAALPFMPAAASLVVIILGRIAAGIGESQFVTGCVSWSVASVAPQRAGNAMSWTGIAMFAALAIGAPVGMALQQTMGLPTAMAACIAAPLAAILVAVPARNYTIPTGERLPFYKVIGQIWQEGLGLMLQGVGVSGLTAFASLYFSSRHWASAGVVMTAFGVGFIAVRLLLGTVPDKIGGYKVAIVSTIVEALGQLLIWCAPNEMTALIGAFVTGLGCALIFPALGVEALKKVLPSNRGSAIGAFVAFLDIAYGVSGPLAGLIASDFGYAAVYLFGAVCAVIGFAIINNARSTQLKKRQ